jgi:SsrA-binding protein
MHIAEFKQASYSNHEPLRERKLLLNRKELDSLRSSLQIKGLTIIPIMLFETDKGFFKLESALSVGKKNYDKRDVIKSRDIERELKRVD